MQLKTPLLLPLFLLLHAVSELAEILAERKILAVGVHNQVRIVDMKPVVFVQIFVINRHADHLGDEHGMAAECAALGDAAGDVDRTFRDSGVR